MSEGLGNCDVLTAETLSAQVDGELDAAEAREVERHLEGCAHCRARFLALDRTAGLVGVLRGPPEAEAEARFLARLDERLAGELWADGLLRKGAAGSGRYTRRAPVTARARLFRVAAAVGIAVATVAIISKLAGMWSPGKPHGVQAPGAHAAPEVALKESEKEPSPPPSRVEGAPTPEPPGRDTLAKKPPTPEPRREEAPVVTPERVPTPERRAEEHVVEVPPPGEKPRPRDAARWTAVVRDGSRPQETRVEAIYELAKVGGPEAAAVFNEILEHPPSPLFTREACKALGRYPWPEGALLLAKNARKPEARAALGAIEDRAVLASLVKELPRLRKNGGDWLTVAEALARAKAPRIGEALVDALRAYRDTVERVRLLVAMGDAADAPARAALAKTLKDRDEVVRAAACRGLERARPEAGDVPPLSHLLASDASALVRAAAASALSRAQGEVKRVLFDAYNKDASPRVRSAAAIGMVRLLPNEALRHGAEGAAIDAAPAYLRIPVVSSGVVFLIDASDSMLHARKIERATHELIVTLRALPAGTPFEVGYFTDGVRFFSGRGLETASPQTIDQAVRFLEGVRPAGGRTNFGESVKRALEVRGVDEIFLLTDGSPTAGPDAEAVLEWLRAANWEGRVRIHAIALYDGEKPLRVDDAPPGLLGASPLLAPAPIAFLRRLVEDNGGLLMRND